jgi:phage I-like protein
LSAEHITAGFGNEIDSLTESIVYLPEGVHEIHATVNGKAQKRTVTVDQRVLASFTEDLESRLARNVRPFAGFDHAAGAASFLPKEFRYEHGTGLVLDVEWTAAGKAAIQGKDYSYFSPNFLLVNGIPAGLAKHGEIGSLVNEPAFEAMEKIAASYNNNKTDIMDITYLVELGLVPEGQDPETAMDVAKAYLATLREEKEEDTVMASRVESIQAQLDTVTAEKDAAVGKVDDLTKQVDDLTATVNKAEDEKVDQIITEAVNAGRIAPQDDASKTFWKNSIKADKSAAGILAALPAKPVNGEVILAGKAEGTTNETDLKGIAKVEAALKAQKDS